MRDPGYYIDRMNQYVDDVISGKVLACQTVIKACKRHLNDLKRSSQGKFDYHFNHARAEHACQFIEYMPHIKGDLASKKQLIMLEPWQCFVFCSIFGWVDSNGYRRFNKAYVEVPRKNGKSPMGSGVGLYCLSADKEEGAEVYSAGANLKQAKITFNDAKAMVVKSPDLSSYFGIEYTSEAVFIPTTNSTFQPLAKDNKGTLDGKNIHCAIVDELHAHPNGDTYKSIVAGMAARAQPLCFTITTAGGNRTGICFEQHTYIKKMLDNVFEDESYFGIIYSIDPEDDWKDPAVWAKANPNFGVSVYPNYIKSLCTSAQNSMSVQNEFKTKNLNVWINSDSAWMNMDAWNACEDEELKEEQMAGLDCYVGVDLASMTDFCSVVKVYVRQIEDQIHYYVFAKQFLNEKALDESKIKLLNNWADDGYIQRTIGNTTNFNVIETYIEELATEINPKQIAFDRTQANYMIQNLKNKNIKCITEYNQSVSTMSTPMKELEAAVLSGRLHHTGDPCLTWMVSNVVAHLDAKDHIYPNRDKNARHMKIDSAVATIMAIGVSMNNKVEVKKYAIY